MASFSLAIMKAALKNNATYFTILAHNIRGRCCRDGSRGWTFPPILHYILLPCDRCQQRGTLTKWHLTWKRIWRKGVSLNSSMWKNGTHWHSSVLTNVDGDAAVSVGTVKGACCTSAVVTDSEAPLLVQISLSAAHSSCSPLTKMYC